MLLMLSLQTADVTQLKMVLDQPMSRRTKITKAAGGRLQVKVRMSVAGLKKLRKLLTGCQREGQLRWDDLVL
jgi:hypothetical protein